MKLINKNFLKIGSIKARCKTHREKILYSTGVILALVILMASLMCTPAEATYTTDGFGIFVDETFVLPTISSEDAQTILQGVKDHYIREGAKIESMDFLEDVKVEACKITAQDVKSVQEGIAFIVNRKKPLMTVVSKQSYSVQESIQVGRTYNINDCAYNVFDKIKADDFVGSKAYDVLLTMENDVIIQRETKNPKLVVTASEQVGYKGLQFTEDETLHIDLSFVAPVNLNVTCPYGASRMETGYHLGVDLYNPSGTPIVAAAAGVVVCASEEASYGNLIIINHGYNVQTYYAHCRSIDVQVGDTVQAGDFIGTVGSTGRTTGPHLHYELRLNGATLDPMNYL